MQEYLRTQIDVNQGRPELLIIFLFNQFAANTKKMCLQKAAKQYSFLLTR